MVLMENEVAREVVDAAIEVHRNLGGPGLLEAVYEEALAFELRSRGLTIQRQVKVPLLYKGHRLRRRLRVDMVVNGRVVVECKAAVAYTAIFESQALTYIRNMKLRLALVINFGERRVHTGIHRVVNDLNNE